MIASVVGTIAALCTTIATFPQAIKSWKTKKTGDISLIMYSILTTGVLLWIVYGFLVKDWIVFFANIFTFIPVCMVFVLKLRHG